MTEEQDVFRPAEYAWGDEPGAGAQGPSVPAASAPGASATGVSGTGASGTGGQRPGPAPRSGTGRGRLRRMRCPGLISMRCTRWWPGAATSATASSPTRSPRTC